MRVEWTEHAYGQLDDAMAFIARDRVDAASAWLNRILDTGASLAQLPVRGRIVPEIGQTDLREVIISPYRLIYRRTTDAVIIEMLVHERRNLTDTSTD